MNGHENRDSFPYHVFIRSHSVEENWGNGRERKDRERESKGERKREHRDERKIRERAENPKAVAFLG